jgi:hypothetical protein
MLYLLSPAGTTIVKEKDVIIGQYMLRFKKVRS